MNVFRITRSRGTATGFAAVTTVLVAGLLVFPGPVGAADLTVNTDADTVDVDPGDGSCADAGGQCSLRAAVMEANELAGPDTVQLPAGTYALSIAGTAEDASATGDLDVTGALFIVGDGAATTVVDAAGIDRAIDVHGAGLTVDGVTLTGGLSDGDGGALRGGNSPLRLVDAIVGSSVASGDGGGLFLSGGSLDLDGVDVTENAAAYGGGVFAEDAAVTISGGTLSENVAEHGGGLAAAAIRSLVVSGTTFRDNSALSNGGGVWLQGTAGGDPQVRLTDVVFDGNTAGGLGGGLHVVTLQGADGDGEVPLVMEGGSVTGNAAGAGGGLSLGTVPATISGTTFDGNDAALGDGGAILAERPLNLDGLSFDGNKAGRSGGAVLGLADVKGDGLTFTDNTAGAMASALYVLGEADLEDVTTTGGTIDGAPDEKPVVAETVAGPENPGGGGGGGGEPTSPDPGEPGEEGDALDASCPLAEMPTAGFVDTGRVHARAIDCLAWWGIVSGYGDGTFGTNDPVTRGQYVAIVDRILAAAGVVPRMAPDSFADDDGHTHERAADRLAALELFAGYADGRAGLSDPVTRAQVASMLHRLAGHLDIELPAGNDRFDDVDGVHARAIEELAAAGVVAGVSSDRFDPSGTATRGQVASLTARLLGLLVEGGAVELPAT